MERQGSILRYKTQFYNQIAGNKRKMPVELNFYLPKRDISGAKRLPAAPDAECPRR